MVWLKKQNVQPFNWIRSAFFTYDANKHTVRFAHEQNTLSSQNAHLIYLIFSHFVSVCLFCGFDRLVVFQHVLVVGFLLLLLLMPPTEALQPRAPNFQYFERWVKDFKRSFSYLCANLRWVIKSLKDLQRNCHISVKI